MGSLMLELLSFTRISLLTYFLSFFLSFFVLFSIISSIYLSVYLSTSYFPPSSHFLFLSLCSIGRQF